MGETSRPPAARRRERSLQIVETLSRHGLGAIVGAAGLSRRHDARTGPVRLRVALEELGTSFIKLGQIMSTRPDLLPPEYVAELARLQDDAPPVPAAVVRSVIADELGADAEDVFDAFDDVPLASASIGQAHLARIGATEVVVKVRRPGVVDEIAQDLEILENLAVLAARHWPEAGRYDPIGTVEEFGQTLRAELDYLREARNAERFADNFAGDPRVRIPRVVRDRSTTRVLTLERVTGTKISDGPGLDAAGVDRRELAGRATGVLCKMIFEDGLFHADPHPGNFLVEPDGRLGVIDFGMVGEIDRTQRDHLVAMLLGLVRGDPDRLTSALLGLAGRTSAPQRDELRESVAVLLRRLSGSTLAEIHLAQVLPEVLTLLRLHRLRLPPETAMLVKVLLMADGLGKQLDPGFDLMAVLAPYARSLALEAFSPESLLRWLGEVAEGAMQLGADAPDNLRRLMAVLERGGIDLHVRAAEVEPIVARAERVGNRLVAGAIAAALINGVGKIVAEDRQRFGRWEAPLLAVGVAGVGALGAYLAGTVRPRRRPPQG